MKKSKDDKDNLEFPLHGIKERRFLVIEIISKVQMLTLKVIYG